MRTLLAFALLLSTLYASPQEVVRKVEAHLLIGDPVSALAEANLGLATYPGASEVHEMVLRSLAAAGDEGRLIASYALFREKYPEEAMQRPLLEEVCWGILHKGLQSNHLTTRLIALIASALTQDVRGAEVLQTMLHDSNAHLRNVAVELSALYGDAPLKDEVIALFPKEKNLDVRLSILAALGKWREKSALPDLLEILGSNKRTPEEKSSAMQAIIEIAEAPRHEELVALAGNKRSRYRQLASATIAECALNEERGVLLTLLCDPSPSVKVSALKAAASLSFYPVKEVVACAESKDPAVAVTAAWLMLQNDSRRGESYMRRWLEDPKEENRLAAAGAVGQSGHYGSALAREYLEKSFDPYVRVNMALSLIHQRVELERACSFLDRFLQENEEQWMWGEGLFRTLQKSDLRHHPLIPNYPEAMNQKVRLELINILAIEEYPGALAALKAFVKERRWGVTGAAAELLLGVGDETAIDLIRELLDDPDEEVRMEAALILASWGRDARAIPTLLALYPGSDKTMKIKVLESLSRIGDPQVIPFLIGELNEPFQTLRLIAACVLILTLNH